MLGTGYGNEARIVVRLTVRVTTNTMTRNRNGHRRAKTARDLSHFLSGQSDIRQ